jgi:hypothetical protein
MFNNLSNSGEYRVNFDMSATTALLKWLNWNIALSDRYLSNPFPDASAMTSSTASGSVSGLLLEDTPRGH